MRGFFPLTAGFPAGGPDGEQLDTRTSAKMSVTVFLRANERIHLVNMFFSFRVLL